MFFSIIIIISSVTYVNSYCQWFSCLYNIKQTGPLEGLLIYVKKRKLKWYGYVIRTNNISRLSYKVSPKAKEADWKKSPVNITGKSFTHSHCHATDTYGES